MQYYYGDAVYEAMLLEEVEAGLPTVEELEAAWELQREAAWEAWELQLRREWDRERRLSFLRERSQKACDNLVR
jgi:hypothetical protein